MWCRSRRFDCILLVFFRRWSRLVMSDLIKHDAPLCLVVFQQLWLVHFDPYLSLSDLLPRRSAVVQLSCYCVFWSWAFWNFYSIIPVDVVRVKSDVNCLFDLVRVVIRVTINKLYFVPERLVSGVVGVLWNGGGLGTGESNVSIVLLISHYILESSFYCVTGYS